MNKLMTHVVAGYPSNDECLELIIGMHKVGVHRLEVQIPFSDPSADGPTIMEANDVALENNVTIDDVFSLIEQARAAAVDIPIYIMSYANKLAHVGVAEFCRRSQVAGASGFILPDLALGTPEYDELVLSAREHKLSVVPVVSPGINDKRLKQYLEDAGDLVYLTSMRGITGKDLSLDTSLKQIVKQIRSTKPKISIALGFGIKTPADVAAATMIADEAVVGSAVISATKDGGVKQALSLVTELVEADNA